jgi:peptidoglycan/LPS O-acetylase OafA/YrhL
VTGPTANAHAARNTGIDALRGVSILLVILNHVGLRLPLDKSALASFLPTRLLRDLNYNGYEAVFVFFVISGFLITSRVIGQYGSLRAISLRDFYVRRASRILPCLFALVAVLSLLHVAGASRYLISKPEQSLPGAIAAALGLYLNWYEGAKGYLPGGWDILWSLSIEEVFYLGFPLLCLVAGGTRWLVGALALLAVSVPFTHAAAAGNDIWQEKAYLPGMGAIATGILAALLAHARPRARPAAALTLRVAGIAGLLGVLFAGSAIWALLRDGYLLVLTGSAALLVLGMHWGPSTSARIPGLGWLRSFGRLSYEIYLTHMFCVFAVVDFARAVDADPARGWLWYFPAVGLSWLLGWIVARTFSQPCERRLRARFAAPSAPRIAPVAAPADV